MQLQQALEYLLPERFPVQMAVTEHWELQVLALLVVMVPLAVREPQVLLQLGM